jgi:cardiolipin synthase
MLHAKTAVADGRWARVGSTNLNIASWMTNCELDAVIENETFAKEMEEMYVRDLDNATEIVLDSKRRVRAPGAPRHSSPVVTSGGGSVGRAAAGAIRIGNALSAAVTNRRILEPVEAQIIAAAGTILVGLSVLFWFFPQVPGYILMVLFAWIGLALLFHGYKLHHEGKAK